MELFARNWFLHFCVITVNIYCITCGFLFSWNSPILPKLQSNDSSINPFGQPITLLQVSILSSTLPFATIIGTILLGIMPDLLGRKKSLVYLAATTVTSNIAIYFSTNIYVYYFFFMTLSIGNTSATGLVSIYIVELSEDSNRGRLGSLVSISVSVGLFLAYLIGPMVSVGVFSIMCSIPGAIVLILSNFIVETPIYLAIKGDNNAALEVLMKLRGNRSRKEVKEEFFERQNIFQTNSDDNFMKLFKCKSSRRAFFISLGVGMCQQLCGHFIVYSFLGPLLNETNSSISGEILAACVAVGKIATGTLASSVIEKLGRRVLMMTALFLCSATMFTLGFYYYYTTNGYILPIFIPITCFGVFIGAVTLGLAGLPGIVMSELLPNEYRSKGYSLIMVICSLCLMTASFSYPIIVDRFGVFSSMFAISFINFCGFFFVLFKLPETKGKSFAEIKVLLGL